MGSCSCCHWIRSAAPVADAPSKQARPPTLIHGLSIAFHAGPSRRYSSSSNSPLPFQAIHALLCCFLAVWLLTNTPLLGSSCSGLLKLLSLDQISSSSSSWLVRLLCPLTDAVSSSSNALLARNLFFGYMFGRVVENTGGSGALWLTYVLSAVGEVGPMGGGGG